jgi:hypothetical protein
LHTAAAKMNQKAKFEGLHVHGLLADLQVFHFYSFDPTQEKFAFDETLLANASRDGFVRDMIHGM